MGLLLEIDYEKIFSPKTMAALKGKSGESLRQMLGNKNLTQTLMRSQQVLNDIIAAEKDYRDELEMVAAQMVTDAYPIIDYANIRIDGKIVGMEDLDIQAPAPQDNPSSPDFGEDDPEKLKAKRRIINGITQGASIRGAFGFMLFREYLDQINPELVSKYNEILKLVFGIYDDPNAIAMMLAMLAQGQKQQGGESEMEYDEENEQFVIKAKAICFPMLVHEIVKGLYEIVGTEGFGADKEKNQAIINAVDKLKHEPEDLQYGKFIYDAVSDLYNQSDIDDPRVRELFFASVYKLSDEEFFPFIENAINGELTSDQKKWAVSEMNDILRDLKKDDTGLQDLDEKKADRCLRIARRKYSKPSAYRSGAIVKCRQGKIWKGLNENDIPEGNSKDRVLDALEAKRIRTLAGTIENKLVNKITKNVVALDGEELHQYLKNNFSDRKNSWKARLIFIDLLNAFEGKKK